MNIVLSTEPIEQSLLEDHLKYCGLSTLEMKLMYNNDSSTSSSNKTRGNILGLSRMSSDLITDLTSNSPRPLKRESAIIINDNTDIMLVINENNC